MGGKIKKGNQKNLTEISKSKKRKNYWDNEELEYNKNVEAGQLELIHPDVIAEIPGVELESYYENTMEPALLEAVDPVKDSIDQYAAAKKILI